MRISLLLLLALFTVHSFVSAQKQPISQSKVRNQLAGKDFPAYQLFSLVKTPEKSGQISADVSKYDLLQLERSAIQQLKKEAPESFSIQVPSSEKTYELQLVKTQIFADGFTVQMASGATMEGVDAGTHYQGTIVGVEGSIASLSVYDDRVSALISSPDEGNVMVDKLQEGLASVSHILYKQDHLQHDISFKLRNLR
jgi:hypothetical protein